jgi:predicted small metal-binding protein
MAGAVRTMGCGRMKVACEDGFEVVTKDEKELVALVQWHGQHAHHKNLSEQEIRGMAKHP